MKQTRSSTIRQQKLQFLKDTPITQHRSISFKQISPDKKPPSPVKQSLFFNNPIGARTRPKTKLSPSTNGPIQKGFQQKQSQSPQIHRKNVSDTTLPKISPIKARLESNQIDLFKREIPKPQLIKSVNYRTQAGKNEDRLSKTNQDSYISILQFGDQMSLFGVADGHGQEGHKCSQYIRDHLPKNIRNSLGVHQLVEEALSKAFSKTNNQLCNSDEIISTFSGSTTVVCLIIDRTIYCANIGDSRAILCRQNQNGQIQSIALSNDHKPDLPLERKRIEANGGRVEPYTDYDGSLVGPARVWLMDADIPGLAMSRSFGDKVAASCGCISEPEIIQHQIQENDLFLIIASDGVWEFLDNDQVIDMVYPYYTRDEGDNACLRLVKASTNFWKQNDTVIDDITVLIVFFNKNSNNNNNNNNN